MKIKKDFYKVSALELAPKLLGLNLVHNTKEGITKGKIVEVEAYMGTKDKAAHAYSGIPTKRTKPMFGEAGHSYVYLIYGMYYCMNVVANKVGKAEAVLIRALEPIEGIELMNNRREGKVLKQLCSGPGKLCIAMGINKANNEMDLSGNQLYIEDPKEKEEFVVEKSKRINIDYAQEAKDYLWRYTIKDSKFLS
ncbi:MAG TPA: DNA-3-methyladenine glycosylase [Clostridiales bacterium]|nr:DNA-3-methyladenine glycosylase [Oscillospiraceae bacterium]HHX56104.1 DNA-3-methyladenine glycosylase [Clostridiales bacterium]